MRKVVGIDRKIKRAWLDAVLDRLAQTTDETELRAFLDERLEGRIAGQGVQCQERRHHPAHLERHSDQNESPCGTGPWHSCPESPARNASGCIGA